MNKLSTRQANKPLSQYEGKTPVFVYGTLRLGEINDIHKLAPAVLSLGFATVRGHLYDCGRYPAIRLDENAKPVLGEVYACDRALIAQLDEIEIHYPTVQGAYQRSSCEVQCGKLALNCLIYEITDAGLAAPEHIKHEITDGDCLDWVTYRVQRGS